MTGRNVSDAEHQEEKTHGASRRVNLASPVERVVWNIVSQTRASHFPVESGWRQRWPLAPTCLLCPAGLRGLSIFGVWRVKPLWKVPRWIGVAVTVNMQRGPLDLPFLPRSICRRQTTGDAAWLCASSMFPSPAPLRCPGTDRVSLPVSLRNGETRMAAARAHAHATLADWGQQPTS
jgi:hypothetical protein